jgi:HAD superfamily hydrolase (TIGR01549 family)
MVSFPTRRINLPPALAAPIIWDMIKAVVFDLDGTLTRPVLDFARIRAEIGLAADGRSIVDQMNALPGPERERAWAIMEAHEERAADVAEPNAGVGELFARIARLGLLTAVVTRNSSRTAARALARLELGINRIIARDAGLPIKPDPAALLALMREWRLAAPELLMVGDYRYDVEAGRAAGTLTCFVTNGEAGDDGGAHYKVETPGELGPLLERLAS